MKFKALRTKAEPHEFVEITDISGIYEVFTSNIPNLMPESATMESIKAYHKRQSPLPKGINLDDYELVELKLFETNVIGADIRNKLTPLNNLIKLLETLNYETDNYIIDDFRKFQLKQLINIELIQSKINIEYLTTLL
jgi:hypothetical protein